MLGTGYVGLVTGACFSELGYEVICVDKDNEKINNLENGILPIYEPGLKEIIQRCRGKNLFFSNNVKENIDIR